MITITNIRSIGDVSQYDEVWAIVRSLKGEHKGIRQVQALSPSWDLFGKYRDLVAAGKWGAETFKSVYVPQFLKEMQSREARDLLNKLYAMDKAGRHVCLVCFCDQEELCHRSIVGGLLQGVGCDVKGLIRDYSAYLKQWKAA